MDLSDDVNSDGDDHKDNGDLIIVLWYRGTAVLIAMMHKRIK